MPPTTRLPTDPRVLAQLPDREFDPLVLAYVTNGLRTNDHIRAFRDTTVVERVDEALERLAAQQTYERDLARQRGKRQDATAAAHKLSKILVERRRVAPLVGHAGEMRRQRERTRGPEYRAQQRLARERYVCPHCHRESSLSKRALELKREEQAKDRERGAREATQLAQLEAAAMDDDAGNVLSPVAAGA